MSDQDTHSQHDEEKSSSSSGEILQELCENIESAMQNLAQRTGRKGTISSRNKCTIKNEIHAAKLFKSYAAMVSSQLKRLEEKGDESDQVIRKKNEESLADIDDIEFMREIPDYLYLGTYQQIGGWNALKRNIFWIRFIIMMCCCVSFVVMLCVPNIKQSVVATSVLLSEDCAQYTLYGEFSFGAYRFALCTAIITWVYSLVFCIYYLIPVDHLERKYIPAAPWFCRVFRWNNINICNHKSSSRFLEIFFDALLCVLCLVAAISSAVMIDHSNLFRAMYSDFDDCLYGICDAGGCQKADGTCEVCQDEFGDSFNIYDTASLNFCKDGSCIDENGYCESGYTYHSACGYIMQKMPSYISFSLRTYVKTYENMQSNCIDNTVLPRLQASISFLFFASFLLLFALQITLRSYYLEKRKSNILSGKESVPLPDSSTHLDA